MQRESNTKVKKFEIKYFFFEIRNWKSHWLLKNHQSTRHQYFAEEDAL